jgi:hypothetical protein
VAFTPSFSGGVTGGTGLPVAWYTLQRETPYLEVRVHTRLSGTERLLSRSLVAVDPSGCGTLRLPASSAPPIRPSLPARR